MLAGKLRHRITIEEGASTQQAGGEEVIVWTPIASRINAEVLPDRAGEFFSSRQIQATTNALIRMRYRTGIDEDKAPPRTGIRVVHHVRTGVDEYWDVQGIVHFQSRFDELRLMCVRRDAEGYRRGADLENPTT